VSSKLCHELGEPNRIHVTSGAAAGVTLPAEGAPFSQSVSSVLLEGTVLDIGT
jgi:hypothetical protein